MSGQRIWIASILIGLSPICAAVEDGGVDPWPPMGPVPAEYDRSDQPLHYGKKVEYMPAKQREILWKGRVRKEHPRLYVTPEDLGELKERMKQHPAWPHLLRHADRGDPLACAFVFLVLGDKNYARQALRVFDDANMGPKGAGGYRNALIFDWCFYAIPEERFEDIVMKLAKAGIDETSVDPGGREAHRFQAWRWPCYSDGGAAGAMSLGWSHVYPAIAHHWPGAEVEYMNMWHPDGGTFSDQLGKDIRSIDGSCWWWPSQGKPWYHMERWIRPRFALPTATGIDILDEVEWGPNFNNRLYWALYAMDLDRGFYLNHYTSHHNFPGMDGPLYLRDWAGPARSHHDGGIIYAQNHSARNPHYQWMINQMLFGAEGGPVEAYKDDTQVLVDLALWWHPDVPEIRPAGHGEGVPHGLPYARFLAPGEMQTAAFRSGFDGKGDVIALLNHSDGHCQDVANDVMAYNNANILLYRDEFLITHTPYGPFIGMPWCYSGMSYFDTSTRAETGWDRTVKPQHSGANLFQRAWVPKFPRNVYMKAHAFESRADYDYLAVEGTPQYWSPTVSKEWTQQIVFLRPGVVVIFNRAEVADPRYQPRWIVNMKGGWPEISGNRVRTIVADHVEDYDGDELSYAGVMGRSRLHLKSLLPRQRLIRVVHGHLGDTPCSKLVTGTYSKVLKIVSGVRSGAVFTLGVPYRDGDGKEITIPAIGIAPAAQPREGVMIVKVKRDRLQIVQTAAQKDETFFFAHYPTIEELAEALSYKGWPAVMCATYENWMEGVGPNSDVGLKERLGVTSHGGAKRSPYDGRGKVVPNKRIHTYDTYPDLTRRYRNHIGQTGHLEVRLPSAEAPLRNYFLSVLTATDAEATSPAIPASTLEEDERTATAVVKWAEATYRITFNKSGALGGHIRIERAGKPLVDQAFTNEIYLQNQAFGTDFLTGRQKAPQAQGETP